MNAIDVNVTTRNTTTKEQVFKDREPRKVKNVADWEKKKSWKNNGGKNSTSLKSTNRDRRVIHIHGGMWAILTQPSVVASIY